MTGILHNHISYTYKYLYSTACSASDADTANSGGWFLHSNGNSQPAAAALYQRVRDLFHTRSPGPRVPAEGQEAPTMTGEYYAVTVRLHYL